MNEASDRGPRSGPTLERRWWHGAVVVVVLTGLIVALKFAAGIDWILGLGDDTGTDG